MALSFLVVGILFLLPVNDARCQSDSTTVAPVDTIADPLVGTLVLVKGGTFAMGCLEGRDSNCGRDEKPPFEVTLSDYYIGQTEVTQEQWRAVMGSDPPELYHKGCDQCPVERVSWTEVQDFLSTLNNRSNGARYRLPTEAEWEYAARGGNQSRGYAYSGSNKINDVAWYAGNSGGNTQPVKGKVPNELGLYDMSGNVWEWCADWYGVYPTDSMVPATAPATGLFRVDRGGSREDAPLDCRVSNRSYYAPEYRFYDIGFRLARDL